MGLIWIEYQNGRKIEYEANSFTIEDGCLVLWSAERRLAAVASGLWVRVAHRDWLKENGSLKDDEL